MYVNNLWHVKWPTFSSPLAGQRVDHSSDGDPRCAPDLHYPQHHGVRQAVSVFSEACGGGAAGRTCESSSTTEPPEPESRTGHQQGGRGAAGQKTQEKVRQPEPSQLLEKEEEANATAGQKDRWREEEEEQAQEEERCWVGR